MTTQVEDETPEAGTETPGETTLQVDLNSRTNFMFGIPVGLKIELEKHAKSQSTTAAEVARKALAAAVGYTLPESKAVATRKYASEEERKNANKAKQKEKRDMVKQLYEQAMKAAQA